MYFKSKRHIYQSPDGDEGGGAAVVDTPAPTAAPAAPAPAPAKAAAPAPAEPVPSPAAPVPPTWPTDWRTRAAGGDEKTAKLLERYTTPNDVAKALREVNLRISKGELKASLKKDASPEDVKAWREEQGIPDTPDKYDLTMPDGLVIGDSDKPYVDAYVNALHAENASPAMVKAGIAAYMTARQEQAAQFAIRDGEHTEALEAELVKAWGHSDYKRNIASVKAMLSQADSTVSETVLNARGPDGRAIANNPGVLKWLTDQARQLGYVGGTVVPSGGSNADTIDSELSKIKAMQYTEAGARNPAYWKDDKVQKRYLELLSAKERLK